MDRQQYVHKRKGRYMAQLLEEFEKDIEPLVPASASAEFKALVRRKMNALAVDCCELMNLDGTQQEINGHAQDVRDRVSPDASRRTGTQDARVQTSS